MRYLRQSTSADVPIGPFVDATDGVTAETGLTITQPDVRLKKNAGAWAQKAAAQTLSHEENGFYEVTLDATDTDTLGLLRVAVFESGAAPVWEDFMVITAQEFDRLFTATGQRQLGLVATGTAQSATSTTVVLAAGETFADDVLNGMTLVVHGATQGYTQVRQITDYVGSTDTATVDAWTVTPSGTITYWVFATPPAVGSGTLPAVNVTQFGGVAGTFASGRPNVNTSHVAGTSQTAGDLAALITTVDTVVDRIEVDTTAIEADTQDIQARIPAALVGGRIDATVDGTGMEAGAVTAIQSGLATAANLATVDTVVDAIKAKTDLLSFSDTDKVLADTRRMNNTAVQGNGTAGNKWRG